MLEAMDLVGNPSSVHAEGRVAKALIEKARSQVARLVGCEPGEVVFTSGATEAISLAMSQPAFEVVRVVATDHDSMLTGASVTAFEVNSNGQLRNRTLWEHRGAHEPLGLFGYGAANSETGVLLQEQWIQDVAAECSAKILCDAVQIVGKAPFNFLSERCHLAAVSGHKLGSAKGVGALIVAAEFDLAAHLRGGGQEMGRRSGTENVMGIAGFGAAAEAALRDLEDGVWERVEKLRNILEDALASASSETIFVGKDTGRLPNTSCFMTPGWKGEMQVMQMDLAGFAVSAGSACSSGKVKASRVLGAMGFDEVAAASAIRVSLGPTTTEDDVLRFAEAWMKQEQKFRRKAA